ncbi:MULTISPECIES: tyrosine-type recombinase/integrase [Pseudooceanicola]|nr:MULTISPECIES: integrase [Pseudooceanicola]
MVLAIYADEHAPHVASPARIGYAIEALDRIWQNLPVSAIKGETCRRYATQRGCSDGTIRRELGVLQAALNYCHREGYLVTAPKVTLPPKPDPRERWLTRQEAAWLLRGARALNKDGRHLQDFILHGLYTGSRKATILAMHIDKPSKIGGHVDTVNGILYRKPQGKRETNKRQRPARLPERYLAHLRRQARNGRQFVVERKIIRRGVEERCMVADIKKGWPRAVSLAMELAAARGITVNLTGITPHVLKHTAITWALQRGATTWDAAGYFGTSIETIERVYGHHAPDHMQTAVNAMNKRA